MTSTRISELSHLHPAQTAKLKQQHHDPSSSHFPSPCTNSHRFSSPDEVIYTYRCIWSRWRWSAPADKSYLGTWFDDGVKEAHLTDGTSFRESTILSAWFFG